MSKKVPEIEKPNLPAANGRRTTYSQEGKSEINTQGKTSSVWDESIIARSEQAI